MLITNVQAYNNQNYNVMFFWCMWPAKSFQKLNSEFKYPIILTSGTLFPLET